MIAFLPPWTGCCKASMKAVTPRQGRISYRVRHGTLIIDLKEMYRIISSAPRRGGIVRARSILNHQVPANPSGHRPGTTKWSDPARYLGRLAVRVRARMPVIGLMTAVPMTQLIVDREQAGAIWLECFCTVGVTNAVRAGDPLMVTGCDVNPPGAYQCGERDHVRRGDWRFECRFETVSRHDSECEDSGESEAERPEGPQLCAPLPPGL